MKLFRKSLAVILALVMICSGLALGASAEGETTLSLTFTGSVASKTITATVSGGAADATYTFTMSPYDSTVNKIYPSGTSCDFTNITVGTEYTITVTDGTNTATGKYTVNKEAKAAPKADDVTKTVSSDGKTVTLELAGAEFSRTSDFAEKKASAATFTGLSANTTYTFYARYAETDTTLVSDAVSFTVITTYLEQPIPTVGTTTIDVVEVSGVQFAIYDAAGTTMIKDWQTSGSFTGLTAGTKYTVMARLISSTGTTSSITCTTLSPNESSVVAPSMAEVTQTSIKFVAVDGYEYSIDSGKNYQTNVLFQNLTAGKSYSCCQRIASNGVSSASAASSTLIVTTNTAAPYAASISNVAKNSDGTFYTITSTETIRVNSTMTFTVFYDAPTSSTRQWGDTRYIPVSITDSNSVAGTIGTIDESKRTYSCTITPSVKGDDTIFVNYVKEQYKGAEGWQKVDGSNVTKSFKVSVNVESNSTRDFFVQLADLVLNTIPKYLTKFVEWLKPVVQKYLNGDYNETLEKLTNIFSSLSSGT